MSLSEPEIVSYTFISSHLDYCNSLFTCLSKSSLDCLQVVQISAARLLTKSVAAPAALAPNSLKNSF